MTLSTEKSRINIDMSITWTSGHDCSSADKGFAHTHRQNNHHRPAVHSNDVIHIHRSACQARSAFSRLNSFLSLSLHHYPCAAPLASLSFHVSFALFFNNSLYHLLMLFSLLFQPSAPLADLILPSLFNVPLPRWLLGVTGY